MINKNLSVVVFCLSFSFLFFLSKGQAQTSHWSLALNTGIDYYFVSPRGDDIVRNAGWMFPGAIVEYNFNTMHSIGVCYDYLTNNRLPASGKTSDISVFYSYNYFNFLLPERSGFLMKTNAYVNIGAGIASYSYRVSDISIGAPYSGGALSPLGTFGLSFEQNLSDVFALRLEGQLRYYTKNDIGGAPTAHSFGNLALVGTIGLRYKFGAVKKTHFRNLRSEYDCKCYH